MPVSQWADLTYINKAREALGIPTK